LLLSGSDSWEEKESRKEAHCCDGNENEEVLMLMGSRTSDSLSKKAAKESYPRRTGEKLIYGDC
jgi:hypothetical protein